MRGVAARDFRRALGQFASGVTVVTTQNGRGEPLGLTVTAFSSLSLEPPLVLVCIDNHSETHEGFRASGRFGVSILAEDQDGWSRRFAVAGPEKFQSAPLIQSPGGLSLVPGALAHIECRVSSALPGGDHTIYVGEVTSLAVAEGRPLLHYRASYRRLEGGREV